MEYQLCRDLVGWQAVWHSPDFYQNFMKNSPDMDGLCLSPGLNLCPSGKLHGRSSPNTTGLDTIRE